MKRWQRVKYCPLFNKCLSLIIFLTVSNVHDQRWSFHDNGSIGNKVTIITWTLMATNHASILLCSAKLFEKKDWLMKFSRIPRSFITLTIFRGKRLEKCHALHCGPRWRFFFFLFFFKGWLDFVAEKTWEWNFEIMIWFEFFDLEALK